MGWKVFRNKGNWCEADLAPAGRDGARPLREQQSRAVYGGGRLGCGLRQLNSEMEFGTAGCGHPALRVQHRWCAATGRCRHRPLRKGEQAASTSQASGAQRSVCGADGRNGWKLRQGSSTKGPSTADNPSVSLRLTAPFTQGSLRDGGCGLPRRPCGPPRNDNRSLSFRGAERRGNPSFFTMDGGSGRRT